MPNMIKNHNSVKNSNNFEYDLPQDLDSLNKWTIPKIEPKTIYQLGTFEKLGLKQLVKTTEESISLHNDEMIIRLFSEKDILPYRNTHKFLHIGLVQIAFKPLTLEGLPESFIAALRDGRNLNWKQSLMGIIQSSLAHGPVYFDVYPNLQLSLSDVNILDALTLNVKTHGYNYVSGSEVICICYRIYYKPLYTLNPHCKRVDKPLNETILIETNFSKSNIITRRSIKWEEITFPENWIIEKAVPSQPQIQSHLIDVLQTPEGTINLQFENSNRILESSSKLSRSRSQSLHSYISPIDYIVETPFRASTSYTRADKEDKEESLRNSRIDELFINKENIVKGYHHNNQADNIKQAETMSEMSMPPF